MRVEIRRASLATHGLASVASHGALLAHVGHAAALAAAGGGKPGRMQPAAGSPPCPLITRPSRPYYLRFH